MTDKQIQEAKDWTKDYIDVLTSVGRAIAAEAVRVTVPPGSAVFGPDDMQAIWRRVNTEDWTSDDSARIDILLEGVNPPSGSLVLNSNDVIALTYLFDAANKRLYSTDDPVEAQIIRKSIDHFKGILR